MAEPSHRFLSAAGWAHAHGLSERRARQLAAAGLVNAEKSGARWLIDDAQYGQPRRGQRGRPLSERSCWAIIDLLDGGRPDGLSRSEIARAQHRVAAADALLPGELARRADLLQLRAHPGVLDSLAGDARVVLGGVRAASAHGADLVELSGAELYALHADAPELIREYALRPAQNDANVILRVASRLPASSERLASPAAAALDLLDAGDERSVRAARNLLHALAIRARADAGE